ncbi:MAG: DUF3822 family protein [Flavobacteriaceae bacterium]|nr:DUF3822 family protein [Flavobacteriaceae bacterium]
MQLNSNQNTLQDLSILILKDGFSFCTHEQQYFFRLEDENPSTDSLKSWIHYHQINTEKTTLIYTDYPGVTVPLSLFDKEQPQLYLNTSFSSDEDYIVQSKLLDKTDQAIVFPVLQKWQRLFKEVLPKASISHLTALLLPDLAAFSFGKTKKNMFVHLRENEFDLFLFQGGQLLLQNSFPQKNVDDFLYYLFYVTEQFYLKPEQFNLTFMGKYESFDEYYLGAQEFHELIDYFEPHYPSPSPDHPVPFFLSYKNR